MKTLQEYTCKYIIIGDEIAPETRTPHLQGYVYFVAAKDLKTLVKKFPGIHWIVANGTAEHSQIYCSKEKEFIEFGSPPKQGKRTDIENVREVIGSGGSMRDVVSVASSYQSVRMAETILRYNEKKRNFKPEVIWLWGPTGCGKTRKAMDMLNEPWISGKNLKWWDGYDAHEHILIDDFRKDFCTFHELLRILDRYPYTVEVKGGTRQLLARKIIITSCYSPSSVYDTREDKQQLLRRIDHIEMMKNPETDTNTEVGW